MKVSVIHAYHHHRDSTCSPQRLAAVVGTTGGASVSSDQGLVCILHEDRRVADVRVPFFSQAASLRRIAPFVSPIAI